MTALSDGSFSNFDAKTRQLKQHFLQLLSDLKHQERNLLQLEEIRLLLVQIELEIPEYDLCMDRINNARRFFNSGEIGAATFEIHKLVSLLSHYLIEE